jgi:penicillin-binding protein activator
MRNKKIILAAASFFVVTFFTNCSRKITRIDPTETEDISGKWNNTDSRLTSEELIREISNNAWIQNHLAAKNKKPVVIVGMVVNKSHEHIEAETFMKDLEMSFLKTQQIGLVQSGKKREELRAEKADMQTNASVSTMKKFGLENGADYILQGSINSIVDQFRRKRTVTYQINLELTNIETNEIVWIGDKKIAKYIKN